MKKIKKKTAIIIGAITAGIIGLTGKLLIDKKYEPMAQVMYGVAISPLEAVSHTILAYKGEDISGSNLRGLYSTINQFNNKNTDVKNIEYIGPSISEIRSSRKYTVELECDEEGYVCKVIVTENEKINNNNEINNI